MTSKWPSMAETCHHRQTNKLRSLDSCVLTDPPTLICVLYLSHTKLRLVPLTS